VSAAAARTRVALYAVGYGFAEIKAMYTVPGWVVTWLLRVFTQVLFFGLIGQAVGGDRTVAYLVIGNAVVLIALETLFVLVSTVMERNQGTLIVLAASPTGVANVYVARGLQWVISATATSTVALLVLPLLLGVSLPLHRLPVVIPVLFVIALSCNAYGGALSAVALRRPAGMWLVLNLGYLAVATFGGVNVPVSYWPGWLQTAVQVLPLTHGLQAVRDLFAGASVLDVLPDVAAELAVGAGWLVVTLIAYRRLLARCRRDGTLDFIS
jgi:ABC-2 type transport system permease protein